MTHSPSEPHTPTESEINKELADAKATFQKLSESEGVEFPSNHVQQDYLKTFSAGWLAALSGGTVTALRDACEQSGFWGRACSRLQTENKKLQADCAAMREGLEKACLLFDTHAKIAKGESVKDHFNDAADFCRKPLQSTAGQALLDELSQLRKVAEAAQVVSDLNLAASGAQWMDLDVALEMARKK